jgi:hypothetical protein
MSYGPGQNQHPNTIYVNVDKIYPNGRFSKKSDRLKMFTGQVSDDSGERQVGYIPGRMHDEPYEELGVVYKSQWLGSEGYSRDPTGPIMEGSINDNSDRTHVKFKDWFAGNLVSQFRFTM